ncbi:transcriptional regulator [Alteromonas pelagimontana]|uniref:Transcriptional regulator n=1 Tax=Alteromonas pelagimontana TaxID=1858656 RepID=A0A6M4MA39_9ALTE|nr:winged helix-turn-helix domain-containing protein [Alteromonas pelagimontana]QJR79839.1 transcriptional regulator [Alteromonas pelagimontana]
MNPQLIFLGEWKVTPSDNTLRLGKTRRHIEPKVMDVLVLLCAKHPQVVTVEEILSSCWQNEDVGDNPVHKAINQLRRALGDKSANPAFIETIRKRGYRVIAPVTSPQTAVETATQMQWNERSPYPGLTAFNAEDAVVFYGRKEQVSTLLTRIQSQVKFGRAFSLVLGPSGTGKSSLVQAGILPVLTSPEGYRGIGVISSVKMDCADVTGEALFLTLASAILDWEIDNIPIIRGVSAQHLAATLETVPQDIVRICKKALQRHSLYKRPFVCLFLDHLEILLAAPYFTPALRQHFLECIDVFALSGVIMIISACRNDFYPQVVAYPTLMAGKAKGAHFDLSAPSRGELMQMIRLPALVANVQWEIDNESKMPLDDIIGTDAAEHPDALPMLQYTLQELYLRREDKQMSVAVYRELGGIDGAIGRKAEQVFCSLPKEQQNVLPAVFALLITLAADGKRYTSRTVLWSQLKIEAEILFVQIMVENRLFVSHLHNQQASFSLAHEALLRCWERAASWIEQHNESLKVKAHLRNSSLRWHQESRATAFLLAEGKPLQQARDLVNNPQFYVTQQELALINASEAKVCARRWKKRIVFTVLLVLTIISVVMSITRYQAQIEAQQRRLDAENLLGFMVGEFADKLRSVNRMDLLDGISNKALEYFTQAGSDSGIVAASEKRSEREKFQLAQTLLAMGEVAYSRGSQKEAKKAFDAAFTLFSALSSANPDDLENLKMAGISSFWLGQLRFDLKDYISAQEHFERYRAYSQQQYILEPKNYDVWSELSYAHNALGSVFLRQYRYDEASQAFTTSLTLKNKIIAANPDDKVLLADRADTLSWLASTEFKRGKLEVAVSLQTQVQSELLDMLMLQQDDAYIIENLALSHWQYARLLDYTNALGEARFQIKQAIALYEQALDQDKSNVRWQRDIAELRIYNGLLAVQDGATVTADFEEAIEKAGAVEGLQWSTQHNLIAYYQLRGNWKSSEALLQALDVKDEYVNSTGAAKTFQPLVAKFRLLEAKQYQHYGRVNATQEACGDVIQRLSGVVEGSKNVEILVPYVRAHDCSGDLEKVKDKISLLHNMGVTRLEF